MELAYELIDENKSNTLENALRILSLRLAITPHLTTTLRKMGQGQQCSLRFYAEGEVLHPTGVGVGILDQKNQVKPIGKIVSAMGKKLRGKTYSGNQRQTAMVVPYFGLAPPKTND